MSSSKKLHWLSSSSEEDEQHKPRRKKLRVDSNTGVPADNKVDQIPFHANLYMNSLANEGTKSLVNCGCLALRDIINDSIATPDKVLLANYMIDMSWISKQCTVLGSIPVLDIIHGFRGESLNPFLEQVNEFKFDFPNCSVFLHSPRLPFQYGTFHAKFILVHIPNPSILRIAITTANFLYGDWWHKNQMTWIQDFLPMAVSSSCSGVNNFYGPFEAFLKSCLNTQMQSRWLPLLSQFDLSTATVDVVPSIPGYHRGLDVSRYGHPRLSAVLAEKSNSASSCRLVALFSSMGSLQEKWLDEFKTNRLKTIPKSTLSLIYPTVDEVRNSREGWMGGCSLPVSKPNWKPFLIPLLHIWGSLSSSRSNALPHIKTYLRYTDVPSGTINDVDFLYCGSHNLSKAAWGEYQKEKSQLFIRSYELGVVITPSSISRFKPTIPPGIEPQLRYFLPTKIPSQQPKRLSFFWTFRDKAKGDQSNSTETIKSRLVVVPGCSSSNSSSLVEPIQDYHSYWIRLPYSVPPVPYTSDDIPWNVTDRFEGVVDHLGLMFEESF